MNRARPGEDHPRPADDRLPVLLVLLDGLGDRPLAELGQRTPAEAAHTPVLDRLTARGGSGWHLPLGWGRAPSSELAHWALFGYAGVDFPGRAVIEGLGAGLPIEPGRATTWTSLRSCTVVDGQAWVTGRAAPDDGEDARALLLELTPLFAGHDMLLQPVGRGEAVLQSGRFACGAVSDSDPFFEQLHPWLRVLPTAPAAAGFADALNRLLGDARSVLAGSDVNRRRSASGRPALDLLTTKWSGARQAVPSFVERSGVAGAMVTDARLYRGLAALLGMAHEHLPPGPALAADIAARITVAERLIDAGARFVHLHTKAPDEAGHSKDPWAKLKVLEALDAGLARLESLADRAVVAITGDHATPSSSCVLHAGEPTPLLLVGPTVRADDVTAFGERAARQGWFGAVRADELLPLLFSHANRPMFLGHRASAAPTLALPDAPQAMPLR